MRAVYLIDTNDLSIRAHGQGLRPAALVERTDWRSDAPCTSATTMAEVCNGISGLGRNRATRKAAQPTGWLDVVVRPYGDRVIPIDIAAARLAGALMDEARATGHSPQIIQQPPDFTNRRPLLPRELVRQGHWTVHCALRSGSTALVRRTCKSIHLGENLDHPN